MIFSAPSNCWITSFNQPENCIVCAPGFKNENLTCNNPLNFDQTCECPKKNCTMGFSFFACDCICHGVFDEENNYCCDNSQQLRCKLGKTKYIKNENKCGCIDCMDGYIKMGSECKVINDTIKDCFYVDLINTQFKEIPENICIKNIPGMKMIQNQNCLLNQPQNLLIDKQQFYFIFSQSLDAMSSSYKYEGKYKFQNDLNNFNCDNSKEKNVLSYFYLQIDKSMKTDETIFKKNNTILEKSTFIEFIQYVKEKDIIYYKKNSTETEFFNDFTDVLLNTNQKTFSFRYNQDLKNLCINSPKSFIDFENSICMGYEFCQTDALNDILLSKYKDNIESITGNKNSTFKNKIYQISETGNCYICPKDSLFIKEYGGCCLAFFQDYNQRQLIQIFSFSAAGLFFLPFCYFLFLYIKERKKNVDERNPNIMEDKSQWMATFLSIVDFIMDIGFFLSSVFTSNIIYILSISLIVFQPGVYLILGTLFYFINGNGYIRKHVLNINNDCFSIKALLVQIPMYFIFIPLFLILANFNLIANHDDACNYNIIIKLLAPEGKNYWDSDDISRQNRHKLKLWIKLIDFLTEIIWEIVLKIVILSYTKKSNVLQIVAVCISLINFLISTTFYLIEFIKSNENNNNQNNLKIQVANNQGQNQEPPPTEIAKV